MNSQMKKYIGSGQRAQVRELVPLWSWGVIFPVLLAFYEPSSQRQGRLPIPFPNPVPSLEDRGWS